MRFGVLGAEGGSKDQAKCTIIEASGNKGRRPRYQTTERNFARTMTCADPRRYFEFERATMGLVLRCTSLEWNGSKEQACAQHPPNNSSNNKAGDKESR